MTSTKDTHAEQILKVGWFEDGIPNDGPEKSRRCTLVPDWGEENLDARVRKENQWQKLKRRVMTWLRRQRFHYITRLQIDRINAQEQRDKYSQLAYKWPHDYTYTLGSDTARQLRKDARRQMYHRRILEAQEKETEKEIS